jgi:hypothetical protein
MRSNKRDKKIETKSKGWVDRWIWERHTQERQRQTKRA